MPSGKVMLLIQLLTVFMIGLFTGIVAGCFLVASETLAFDPTLNLTTVIQVSGTITSAIIISFVIQKLLSREKSYKDLLTKQLDLLLDSLKKISEYSDRETVAKVTMDLRNISNRSVLIKKIIDKRRANVSVVDSCNFKKDLIKLRTLLTWTPPDDKNSRSSDVYTELIVVDGNYEWSKEQLTKIIDHVSTFEDKIYLAQFEINSN